MKLLLTVVYLIIFYGHVNAQSAEELIQKAQVELDVVNYKKAIELYTKLIEKKSGNSFAYTRRAYAYYSNGQFKNCIKDCNKSLSLKPEIYEKYYTIQLRGFAYLSEGKWEMALKDFDLYLRIYYEDVSVGTGKALALYKMGRYTESIDEYTVLLKNKSLEKNDSIECLSYLGFNYLGMDSVAKAKRYYSEARILDSLDSRQLYLGGAITYDEENYKESIKLYDKIIKTDSSAIQAFLYCGRSYHLKMAYDTALFYFNLFKNRGGKDDYLNYDLAKAEQGRKNDKKALIYLKTYLIDNPNSSDLNNSVSWALFELGDFNNAFIIANRAVKNDTNNADAYDTRGCIFYKLMKYNLAIKDFTKALVINPLYINSYYYRGLCYNKLTQNNKACADWLKVKGQVYTIPKNEKDLDELIDKNCKP